MEVDEKKCWLCGKNGSDDRLEIHHVFQGANKKNSEKYGLLVYLCGNECHRNGKYAAHRNNTTAALLHKWGQGKAMRENGWTVEQFREIFGKSYIQEEIMNKVILVGNLTKNPEMRTTPTGVNAARFTVAVRRRFAKEGQQQADFINCIAWRQQAEFLCKYFTKGSGIQLCGSIQTRSWADNNNNMHYATEVIAEEISFNGPKRDNPNENVPSPDELNSKFGEGFAEYDEFADIDGNDENLPFS